jgi:hypothetical protein
MRIVLTIICLSLFGFTFAQKKEVKQETKEERQQRYIEEANPFRKNGYRPRIVTLSKGKYREAFPDTIVQVGSFTYNKKSKSIIGFYTTEETQKSEADLRPDLVSRWMNPDPLSEEFPSWSPYNFTKNNPIYFNDPTGLAPEAPLDDYGIDADGNITLLQETDDNFDRLFAVDNDGNKIDTNNDSQVDNSDSVTVNDQTILPELSEIKETSNSNYHGLKQLSNAVRGEGSQDDLFKVFNFAANNSNVEWSLYRANVEGSDMFGLGTYHNPTVSPGATGMFTQSQIVAGIHSHPNIPTTMSAELDSMGGDSMSRIGLSNRGLNYSYYTYLPNSGRVYSIDGYGRSSFIRNTNGNHKRFYFGTLNSK